MLRPRVIPVLLLDGTRLVKTTQFRSPIYVGDPINAVRIFNEKEVDELVLLDISAGRQRREPDISLVESVATEAFMPICYGGGVTTIEQMRALHAAGIEKVAVNTAMVTAPEVVALAAAEFGSQSVVVSIDVKRSRFRRHPTVVVAGGTRVAGNDVLAAARAAGEAGAGELLLTSVDREGTGTGLDLELLRAVTASLNIPVVAHGGVGGLSHIDEGFDAGASGIACGSFFVLHGPHRAVMITYLDDMTRRELARRHQR